LSSLLNARHKRKTGEEEKAKEARGKEITRTEGGFASTLTPSADTAVGPSKGKGGTNLSSSLAISSTRRTAVDFELCPLSMTMGRYRPVRKSSSTTWEPTHHHHHHHHHKGTYQREKRRDAFSLTLFGPTGSVQRFAFLPPSLANRKTGRERELTDIASSSCDEHSLQHRGKNERKASA
jgi:hypothetical protein